MHVGESELEDLNLTLIHHHLSMLEEPGLIRWDRGANDVHNGPLFAQVWDLLEAIDEYDPITIKE